EKPIHFGINASVWFRAAASSNQAGQCPNPFFGSYRAHSRAFGPKGARGAYNLTAPQINRRAQDDRRLQPVRAYTFVRRSRVTSSGEYNCKTGRSGIWQVIDGYIQHP